MEIGPAESRIKPSAASTNSSITVQANSLEKRLILNKSFGPVFYGLDPAFALAQCLKQT